MRVRSLHRRRLPAPPERVGALLDTLASDDDRLWPHERWPPMRFDRPLGAGADGGHAFVRYTVAGYEPGRSVEFRIHGPQGFSGRHGFHVHPDEDGAVLTHWIEAEARGRFIASWLLAVRPLHDALVEDALDKAERAVTGRLDAPARWSRWVHLLRRLGARRRRGAQASGSSST